MFSISNTGGHSHHDIDLGSVGIPEGGSDASASASVLQLLHGRQPAGSSSSSSAVSPTTTPSPAILAQYLMQRSEAARESYPSALSRPSNGAAQDADQDFARKKLYLKTDCRKVYFPGSVIEGVVALDRSWFNAGSEAPDGFDRVSVTFEGKVSSYGIENKTANRATVEELVLFSDSVTLKPFVTDRVEENSPTGLSITNLELHDADSSLQGWHLRAVLPESVHATRYVTSKNLFTKRKETFDVLLPPTFRDDRRARAGQNSVCYSFVIRASRHGKNQPDSTLTVPILFMPFALGPSPPLIFTSAHGHESNVQTFRERLRRGLVLDRGIFIVQVTVPTLQNVRTGMRVPVSVICSVSSKEKKDLGTEENGGGGAITMPTLPLSGARESFPTFVLKRVEHGRAGWSEEVVTNTIHCDTTWDDGHLRHVAAAPDADSKDSQLAGWQASNPASSWCAPYRDSTTGRWTRLAHVTGRLSSSIPPPVATHSLKVSYTLAFSWKVASHVKISGAIAPWQASSGVDARMLATDPGKDFTQVALGADYASLRAVASPALASPSAQRGTPTDWLPSYAASGSRATAPVDQPNDEKPPI